MGETFFSKYKTYLILSLIIGILIFTHFLVTKDLKSVPTCLFGCDYYYENGMAMDLVNNPSNTYKSASHDWINYTSSLPKSAFYYHATVSKLFFFNYFDTWKAIILGSYFLIILGFLGWFFFFRKVFQEGLFESVLFSTVAFNLSLAPYFKYNHLNNVFLPILLLSIFLLMKNLKKSIKQQIPYWIFSILILIFFSNIHAMSLFIGFFFLGFGYLFLHNLEQKTKIKEKLKQLFSKKELAIFSGVVIISLLLILSLGWWRVVIFEYGSDENAYKFDIHPSLTESRNFFPLTISWVKGIFFTFGTIERTLKSLIAIAAILIFLIVKFKHEDQKKLKWIFSGFFISVFHYFITIPIFGKDLSPSHALSFLSPLFYAISLLIILKTLKNIWSKKIHISIISVLIVIFLMFSINASLNQTKGSFWQNGHSEIPFYYQELQQWYRSNDISPSDTIFISTNELSFAVHGITGNKLFLGRQSHFFHFGDFQKTWMDGAIILYGNNSEVRREKLNEYLEIAKSQGKELYIYWDHYWINSDYQFDSAGNAHPFDPIRFEYSEDRKK
jgi:hypothetical protein